MGSRQALPVGVIEVLQRNVPEYVEFVGQIEAPQNVEIRARIEGFVQKVGFVEGTEVEEGDLLFIIDPRQYRESLAQARGTLEQLEAQRAQAGQDVERFEPLAKMQAISQQELDNAIAVEAAAEAAAAAQRAVVRAAQLDLGYTVLRAPVSGRIGDKLVDIGDFVGRGEPTLMAVISTVDSVWVNFSVSEVEFLEFNREAQALGETGRERSRQLAVELLLADGSVLPHPGRINFADRIVDPATGTLRVRAAFHNPEWLLRPGQFAHVRLRMRELPDALIVPQRAVLQIQDAYAVYVVSQDSNAVFRTIQPGPQVGSWWVVNEGLKPGDRVVVAGLEKLSDGMAVQPSEVPLDSLPAPPPSTGAVPSPSGSDTPSTAFPSALPR